MFRISKQVDFASQFMLALSKSDSTISVKDFSSTHNVSFLFMQHIVQTLKKHGYIMAKRGARGGYYRTRKTKVSLFELVELFEGELSVAACTRTKSEPNCDKIGTCTMHASMKKVQQELTQSLSTIFV